MTQKFPYQAALFDLDGVILDTESQYTKFWGETGRKYRPDVDHFENRIKGQTLVQIYDQWFADDKHTQKLITKSLKRFETNMRFNYIKGALPYLVELNLQNIPTAIVTSSNLEKMAHVYRAHPELERLFTRILTSEDFVASKPDPDCYLKAAEALGADINKCVVFEDSINGLLAGRASGAHVIGLATTNTAEAIAPYCDETWPHF